MRWVCLFWVVACGNHMKDPAQVLLETLDADGSGGLSEEELASASAPLLYQSLDTDGDGVVRIEELRADLDRWDIGVPKARSPQ